MTVSSSLLKSTVVAALGGLLFGFDTAVIAGVTAALTQTYALSPGGLGLTVASALIGTILGAMLASIPGDRYGRRDSLRVMAVLYFISALGCALAWDWYSLVAFRFIGGLGIGGAFPGSRPVNKGESISLYCTGLGDVRNRLGLGGPSPTSPLASTLTPASVTIGGVDAPVSFAGLAPGFVGLY